MIRSMLLQIFDLLLALGLCLRLTRLVVNDDISLWWVRHPAQQWAMSHDSLPSASPYSDPEWVPRWRSKLVLGLSCPWCVGFWIGCLVLLSLYVAGGPGHVWELWRWVAGAFTLNWIAAHIGPRLGDAGYDED